MTPTYRKNEITSMLKADTKTLEAAVLAVSDALPKSAYKPVHSLARDIATIRVRDRIDPGMVLMASPKLRNAALRHLPKHWELLQDIARLHHVNSMNSKKQESKPKSKVKQPSTLKMRRMSKSSKTKAARRYDKGRTGRRTVDAEGLIGCPCGCGKRIPASANFCGYCGKKINLKPALPIVVRDYGKLANIYRPEQLDKLTDDQLAACKRWEAMQDVRESNGYPRLTWNGMPSA